MSEDITQELPMSLDEKIDQLFLMMRNVISGMNNLDLRMTALEQRQAAFDLELVSLKAGTNPFWQAMHDQQRQILEILQEHNARMDRLEAHLQQQDERMDGRFRKLADKLIFSWKTHLNGAPTFGI